MTDESRTRGAAPHGSDAHGDHEGQGAREAHGADAPLPGESSGAGSRGPDSRDPNSSGVDSLDSLNEGARQVLGDAQVAYREEQPYIEADETAIAAEAAIHGDEVTRLPDGTHEARSVAPGPADDPAGGWADKPVGRKGDRALTETPEEAEARRAEWRE